MKKPEAIQAAATGVFPDLAWGKLYPTIAEYLSVDGWEDGTPRERSSLSLKVQDGCVLAVMQDHDLSRGLYVVGGTVAEALKALEKHLLSATADWRAWKGGKKRK